MGSLQIEFARWMLIDINLTEDLTRRRCLTILLSLEAFAL